MKWLQLVSNVNFKFPEVQCLQSFNVSFKAMCYRLYMIMTLPEGVHFPKCDHCSAYTCQRNCVESSSSKVVIEIGNKYTWVLKPRFGLIRKHFSMFAIPKYTSEMCLEQMQTENVPSTSSSIKSSFMTIAKSLKLLKLPKTDTKFLRHSGPFCVFCNPVKLHRERRRLIKIKMNHQNDPSCYTKTNPMYEKLVNGYCTDTVEILGISNVDVVSPAEALLSDAAFPILKTFVDHLFHKMRLTETLREPNSVLMFCEPLAMHPLLRKQLLHYLFQEVKIARYDTKINYIITKK